MLRVEMMFRSIHETTLLKQKDIKKALVSVLHSSSHVNWTENGVHKIM
jgi:hypothetical protein